MKKRKEKRFQFYIHPVGCMFILNIKILKSNKLKNINNIILILMH